MNKEFFNEQYGVLLAAFPNAKVSETSQEVYWRMLQDISAEDFARAVSSCLATSNFFPTIAELGNIALPPIRDMWAPIPAFDHPWTTLNWQQQLQIIREGQIKRLGPLIAGLPTPDDNFAQHELEHQSRKQEEADFAKSLKKLQ